MRDEDESGQHAADEPTTMWDADALTKLGLSSAGPDTKPEAGPGLAVSVETSSDTTTTAVRPKSPVVGWVITIGLALVLGVGVYFAVRALR